MHQAWKVCRTPQKNRFLTAHEDGRVRLWDVDLAVPVLEFGSGPPARSVAVRDQPHAEGLLVAVGRVDGTLDILALAEPSASRSVQLGLGTLHDLAWVGDRVVMATGSGAIAWVEGEQLVSAPMSEHPLLSLDVHPDGCRTAVGLNDGSVVIVEWWSPRKTLGRIEPVAGLSAAWSVAWGPGDTVLAAVGDALWVADPATGRVVFRAKPELPQLRFSAAAWSPTGEFIAHTAGPGMVVRDPTGKVLHAPYGGHTRPALDLIWLDDRTVSVDMAGDIVVWTPGQAPARRVRPE